jgi:hypothetical protein
MDFALIEPLNVPAGQAVNSPLLPYSPAMASQSSIESDPASHVEPAGQFAQVVSEER